jgi:hypothetical protein
MFRVAIVLGAIVAAIPNIASAQDRFDPAVVTANVGPGGVTQVNKTLFLNPRPGFADIIIAIDTTGSMGPAIAQAQSEAAQMCGAIQAEIPGARFAVVDFKDYLTSPEAEPGDYPYLNKTPGFMVDCATVSAAITSMVAAGGGDLPEAYNRVFFESYSDPVLTPNPQALKFLVVLGDAPPHDVDQRSVAMSCQQPGDVNDAGRDGIRETADDLRTADTLAGMFANDINLLMVFYNTGNIPIQCYEELAVAAAGGDPDAAANVVFGGGAGALNQQVVTAVLTRAARINRVDLVVSPACPLSFAFSPAAPFGPFMAPVEIAFAETITAPMTPGTFACTVTAVVDGASRATETNNITVTGAPPVPPIPPPCEIDIDDFDHDGIRDDYDIDDDNDGRWDNTDDDDDNDGYKDRDDDDDDNDCIKDDHDRKDRHEEQCDDDDRTGGKYGRQYHDYPVVVKPGTLVVIGLIESSQADLLWIDLYDPSGRFVARSTASPGRATVTATAVVPGVYTLRVRSRSVSPVNYRMTWVKGMPW